jgi:hypothetical protein
MTQEKQAVIAFVEIHTFGGEPHIGGYVLRWHGRFVEQEQKIQGRDLGQWLIHDMPPAPNMIMVWEGVCENDWCERLGGDWEPRFHGKWRKPTADELQSLAEEPKQ